MKYKCIKPTGYYTLGQVVNDNPLCELLKDYFASFCYTSKDGVDIYLNEISFRVANSNVIVATKNISSSYTKDYIDKMYSTHKAAQDYLDSLRVKLTPNKWYKSMDTQAMFLFTKVSHSEAYFNEVDGYGFDYKGDWVNGINLCASNPNNFKEATTSEVTEALTKEAVKRGFKEGVFFKHNIELYPNMQGPTKINKVFFEYNEKADWLLCNGWEIYQKGKWAEIIKEPKTLSDYAKEFETYFANTDRPLNVVFQLYFEQNNFKLPNQ